LERQEILKGQNTRRFPSPDPKSAIQNPKFPSLYPSVSDTPKRPFAPGEVALQRVKKEPLAASGDGDTGLVELPVVDPPRAVNARGQRPEWLRVKLPYGETFRQVTDIIDRHRLHTVCQSARCPNMGECWSAGTATFMILG